MQFYATERDLQPQYTFSGGGGSTGAGRRSSKKPLSKAQRAALWDRRCIEILGDSASTSGAPSTDSQKRTAIWNFQVPAVWSKAIDAYPDGAFVADVIVPVVKSVVAARTANGQDTVPSIPAEIPGERRGGRGAPTFPGTASEKRANRVTPDDKKLLDLYFRSDVINARRLKSFLLSQVLDVASEIMAMNRLFPNRQIEFGSSSPNAFSLDNFTSREWAQARWWLEHSASA